MNMSPQLNISSFTSLKSPYWSWSKIVWHFQMAYFEIFSSKWDNWRIWSFSSQNMVLCLFSKDAHL